MTGGFYYAPRESLTGGRVVLPPDESRHAVRVMRLSTGAEIQIVDGEGNWYLARISAIEKGVVTAEVVRRERDVGEPDYELILGVGVLKNAGRFETLLEKAVELGVRTIIPLETERTQKKNLNRSRCERVMIAGLKQAMRSRLPAVTEIQSLDEVLKTQPEMGPRLIAHEGTSVGKSLISFAEVIQASRRCVVLIGPEGGFSDAEIDMATNAGWEQVSLGSSRLRAETAAITAAAVVHMMKSEQEEQNG